MGEYGSGRTGGSATVEGCSSLVLSIDDLTRFNPDCNAQAEYYRNRRGPDHHHSVAQLTLGSARRR
jgi:hypothetical protein